MYVLPLIKTKPNLISNTVTHYLYLGCMQYQCKKKVNNLFTFLTCACHEIIPKTVPHESLTNLLKNQSIKFNGMNRYGWQNARRVAYWYVRMHNVTTAAVAFPYS